MFPLSPSSPKTLQAQSVEAPGSGRVDAFSEKGPFLAFKKFVHDPKFLRQCEAVTLSLVSSGMGMRGLRCSEVKEEPVVAHQQG